MTYVLLSNSPKSSAIRQIIYVRVECDEIFGKIRALGPTDPLLQYDPTIRLIATPMLYSVWERCFSLCHSVSLRLIRDSVANPAALSPERKAIWLIREEFYRSYVDRIKTTVNSSHRTKKGEFAALSDLMEDFEKWQAATISTAIPTEKLVITFSNVNENVVLLNANALGISAHPAFKKIKFGRLHDLVGQRNDIGHGAVIKEPANQVFLDLMEYTENLIHKYTDVFIDWIKSEF